MKAERPIVIDGDVAFVTLTRGLVAIIDAADVPLVRGANWQALPRNDGNGFYAAKSVVSPVGTKRYVAMHRLICPGGKTTDHRDGNGLNNRRMNLRPATMGQNMQNRRRTSNMHGFKGVSHNRSGYQARIMVDGKSKSLGYHPTASEAAAAYDTAALQYFGDFAATNGMLI